MSVVRKVAFVSAYSSACIHRRMRGALSYADAHPQLVIRDFRLPVDFATDQEPAPVLDRLRDWQPDGLLLALDSNDLQKLLAALPHPGKVVNMMATQPRPDVASVAGSIQRCLEIAVRHLRQQGIRSIAMFLAKENRDVEAKISRIFNQVAQPANPRQASFTETVAPSVIVTDNFDAPVHPLPERLAAWLRDLPKPTGVLTLQYGMGGYFLRVCRDLKLRVPEDIAVIGTDDVDLCLASNPTLTSVEPASEVVGFEAMKLLDQMLHGQPAPAEPLRVEATDLHVRQSTGRKLAEICDIAAAVNHINQHACRGLTVGKLLQETQRVSKMTFHKHFLAATGQTPGDAIRHRQLDEARRLLAETKLSITLVAENCGFNSSSDFARAFRAAEGSTPRAYRDRAN